MIPPCWVGWQLNDLLRRCSTKFPLDGAFGRYSIRDRDTRIIVFMRCSQNTSCFWYIVFCGLGGFWRLRKACRLHSHLSWYLSDFMVPIYGRTKLVGAFPFRVPSRSSTKAIIGNNCKADVYILLWIVRFPHMLNVLSIFYCRCSITIGWLEATETCMKKLWGQWLCA